MTVARHLLLAGICLGVGGCSLAPNYQRPAPAIPASWPAGDAYLAQREAALPRIAYQDVFRDARLQRLIAEALVNNRDLRVAAANIERARAQYRIQRAERFPRIDASAGVRRTEALEGGSTTAPSAGSGGVTGGSSGSFVSGSSGTSYSASVGVSAFELDLFGRLRSLSDAALNRFFATEAAARATRLTLVADVAEAWIAYATDRSLLAIAEQTVASAERSVALTQRRLSGGIAPRTDLRQAETVLATAQSDLAELRTALAQDVNALRLLVGSDVDPTLLPDAIETAGATLGEVPAGLDSGILLRRPDVVQAEYELRAANADIGAARAALFPTISLTGLLGTASSALGDLFDSDSPYFQGVGSASYSIFNAGAARANVRASEAQRDALLAAYERAVQTAFREVADALARRGTIADQLAADMRLDAAGADNLALAQMRYRGGIDSFLQTLDAQRTAYAAARTLTLTRQARANNLVTLYRVLGGDALTDAANPPPVNRPAR